MAGKSVKQGRSGVKAGQVGEVEEQLVLEHVCPRCGQAVARKPGRGRAPVWCSAKCRRAASAQRLAAAGQGEPVTVVEVPRLRQRESLTEAVERVLSNPKATRAVLDGLADQIGSDSVTAAAGAQLAPGVQNLVEACQFADLRTRDRAAARNNKLDDEQLGFY